MRAKERNPLRAIVGMGVKMVRIPATGRWGAMRGVQTTRSDCGRVAERCNLSALKHADRMSTTLEFRLDGARHGAGERRRFRTGPEAAPEDVLRCFIELQAVSARSHERPIKLKFDPNLSDHCRRIPAK